MIKNLIVLILFVLPLASKSQSFWTKVDESKMNVRSGGERTIVPKKYDTYSLNLVQLRDFLRSAPLELNVENLKNGLNMDIPLPSGSFESFKIFESPCMEPGLMAKFPNIKSYKGFSNENPTVQIRIALSSQGFYASILGSDHEIYIDPYSEKDINNYIVYYTKDHNSNKFDHLDMCGVEEEISHTSHEAASGNRADEVMLRKYRIAVACTGEWGQVSRRGTVDKCIADMNTMLTRMNSIYEKELAVTFSMIADNDKLIFLDPNTDPYTDSDKGKSIVGLNSGILNKIIPASSYDIGHVLSRCFDIGGVAQLGSLCQSNKGNGVTCNNDNDLSKIVTRVMAHEVGHQFSASHSWNRCEEYSDQLASGTAFEPGSGTTIMSYAGACGVDNVASDSDDYFHVGSLEQMYQKTLSGGNAFACAEKIATGNHFPVVNIPLPKYFIPKSTPFLLTVDAMDEDGDNLTYCWEQFNTGESIELGMFSLTAPLFRSYKPVSENYRFFPKSSSIVSNAVDKTEVLPSDARDLTFRCTVRDNNVVGAGVLWQEYKCTVNGNAGPFVLTYPEAAAKFKKGQKVVVTWDVANTDVEPVNCKSVSIYGSTSGSLVNMIPIALNVPNDGSQEVVVPNEIINFFRFVIKADDNIFLTANKVVSKIEEVTSPKIFFDFANLSANACQPNNAEYGIVTNGLGGLTDPIQFELISGLPVGATATFAAQNVTPGTGNKLIIDTKAVNGNQSAEILVRAFVPGVDTIERTLNLNVIGTDLAGIANVTPLNGASGVVSLPRYNWTKKVDALTYNIQVANNPDFAPAHIVTDKTVLDSTMLSDIILEKSTIYYWRVRGGNNCGYGEWTPTQAFVTEALTCTEFKSGEQSITITGVGTPTVTLPVNVGVDGKANDVNVKLIKIDHARASDLTLYLDAPSGKEILLGVIKCTVANVNVGFDDQSPLFFQCPVNTGKIYRPTGPLSGMNDESIKGDWVLKVVDNIAGSGGKAVEFNLEICSNVTLDQPFLVKNERLEIYPGNAKFISNELLLASDNNNTADELVYTLVSAPKGGTLSMNGTNITTGAQFTQTDLNNSKLMYRGNSVAGSDYFSFTIQDGAGGWVSITNFDILKDESFTNSTQDDILSNDVFIMPNPSSHDINVVLSGKALDFNDFELTDLAGRIILSGKLNNASSNISLSQLTSGIYMLKLTNGKNVIAKKVVKL